MEDKNLRAGLELVGQQPEDRKVWESGLINQVTQERGFLGPYVRNCMDTTDAPPIYHLGVGLAILGAAMGNQVGIPSYGGHTIYPNMFMVLIAPSGLMRKTTALNLGKRLLRSAVPLRSLPDDWTPEKLVDLLQKNPAGLFTISEFTRLLAQLEKEYMGGGMQMLTELYDSPEEFVVERKMGGKTVIKEPALSLLGATTLEWLEECVRRRDLEGGFLARFVFLPALERGPRVPLANAAKHHVYLELKDHLRTVSNLTGRADYSPCWKDYDKWLYDYERRAERKMPPELIGMYSRTGVTTLKLAVIFQASRCPQLQVTPEAMQDAKTFITEIHKLTAMVTEGFGDTRFERDTQKVLRAIKDSRGKIGRSDLLRATKLESHMLDRVVKTLIEREEIETLREKTGGRPAVVLSLIEGERR